MNNRHAVFFLFALLLPFGCIADVYSLTLSRIIVTDGDGIVQDSNIDEPRAQGRLRLETDSRFIVRGMEGQAWFRGEDQPVWDDWLIALDYALNGSRYEFMSLWTNDQSFITFVRRAPPDEGFDPAVIFIVTMENGDTLQLDYRYE